MHREDAVRLNVGEAVNLTTGPMHFKPPYHAFSTQSEVSADVILGQKTAASADLADLSAGAGFDDDDGTDPIAVALYALDADDEIVVASW